MIFNLFRPINAQNDRVGKNSFPIKYPTLDGDSIIQMDDSRETLDFGIIDLP
jgi:hypothetical protein